MYKLILYFYKNRNFVNTEKNIKMALTTYISDLLYRYECVIIPEFGAFLTHQKSASIHAVSHVFSPPYKEVTFNEQLQQNDGLLANHIVSIQKNTYADAVAQIADFVAETKGKLIAGENVNLSEIGHFSLNSDGKLQFTATTTTNYLTRSFGLATTVKTPVLREKEVAEIVTPVTEKKPIAFIPETRKKRSYLKYAAIAIVGLVMFAFFANNYVNTQQLKVAEHNENINIKATKKAYQQASFFTIDPIIIPEASLPITVKEKGNYHIVAGAFRFEENADKKINQLQTEGFAAQKIGVNKYGLHQIVYASYENRKEALQALRNIKHNHNAAAWLLVKKLD